MKMKLLLVLGMLVGPVLPIADAQLLRKRVVAVPVAQGTMIPAPGTVAKKDGLGPVACVAIRAHLRAELIKSGKAKSRLEAFRMTADLDDETLTAMSREAAKVAGVKVGQKVDVVGAIGDGSIINAIFDWLKSPQGQAFIQALLDLLLHSLATGDITPAGLEMLYCLLAVRAVLT